MSALALTEPCGFVVKTFIFETAINASIAEKTIRPKTSLWITSFPLRKKDRKVGPMWLLRAVSAISERPTALRKRRICRF